MSIISDPDRPWKVALYVTDLLPGDWIRCADIKWDNHKFHQVKGVDSTSSYTVVAFVFWPNVPLNRQAGRIAVKRTTLVEVALLVPTETAEPLQLEQRAVSSARGRLGQQQTGDWND